jgi:hypothetical protein
VVLPLVPRPIADSVLLHVPREPALPVVEVGVGLALAPIVIVAVEVVQE